MLVVCPAEQSDPVRTVKPRSREAVEVIEFQGTRLTAPPATFVGECAPAAIALEDLTFDGVGDVARRRWFRLFGRTLSRLPPRGESLLLHMLDQQVERPAEGRPARAANRRHCIALHAC